MTPADLLHSLVAVYPAEGSDAERSGALRGDRRVSSPKISDTMKARAHPLGIAIDCFAWLHCMIALRRRLLYCSLMKIV